MLLRFTVRLTVSVAMNMKCTAKSSVNETSGIVMWKISLACISDVINLVKEVSVIYYALGFLRSAPKLSVLYNS